MNRRYRIGELFSGAGGMALGARRAGFSCVWANDNAEDAPKYTDENRSYKGLKNHRAVSHSLGQWANKQAHINGMESFWAMFKKGFHGTYHRMSYAHLHRYVNEFAGRHNIRSLNTIEQMEGGVKGMNGKRLRYRDLIV